MLDLNATKILVVLVVGLIVLGPDKAPRVARQVGRLVSDFRRFRDSLNTEVREAVGDPDVLSNLPARGRSWMSSVTGDAFRMTSSTGTPTGPSGSFPPDAVPVTVRPGAVPVTAPAGAPAAPGGGSPTGGVSGESSGEGHAGPAGEGAPRAPVPEDVDGLGSEPTFN